MASFSEGRASPDSDIQLLHHNLNESLQCQVCFQNLEYLSVEQRQQHYDVHFSDNSAQSPGQNREPHTTRPPNGKKRKWQMLTNGKPRDLFWYPAQAVPPPANFTPGLILLLKKALTQSHTKGKTRRGALCYERTVHVSSEFWDIGWGCGYRNFLMASTALMDQQLQPLYFPLLDHPLSPSIRNLQQWIEDAWKNGFDPEGAEELGKLVNTRRWIGTSDIWVALSFRGIPSELVDFDLSRDPRGVDVLLDWVVSYFTPSSPQSRSNLPMSSSKQTSAIIRSTNRMPLILQHEGHSRTVVGYEISGSGATNLLVFDPSRTPNQRLRRAALEQANIPITESNNAVAHSSPNQSHIADFFQPIPHKKHKQASDVENPNSQSKYDDDDIVEISPDPSRTNSDTKPSVECAPSEILKFYRLNPKRLGSKSRYQILYFPLTAPLTERERLARKAVYSSKVC